MNSTEMMERFRRFASADLSVTTPNRMHQVSEVLFKTDTVRIILTRDEHRTESLDVDIEVSLPFLPVSCDAISIQRYIDSVIAILEYLRHLISYGFRLEMLLCVRIRKRMYSKLSDLQTEYPLPVRFCIKV